MIMNGGSAEMRKEAAMTYKWPLYSHETKNFGTGRLSRTSHTSDIRLAWHL